MNTFPFFCIVVTIIQYDFTAQLRILKNISNENNKILLSRNVGKNVQIFSNILDKSSRQFRQALLLVVFFCYND